MNRILLLALFSFLFWSCQPQSNNKPSNPSSSAADSSQSTSNEVTPSVPVKQKKCFKIREEIYYEGPDSLAQYIEYEYEDSLLVKSQRFAATGYLQYNTLYSYNDKGQLIRETLKKEGKITNIGNYQYDEQGEKTAFQYKDADGNTLNSESYKNSYNNKGQLIKQSTLQAMGMNQDKWTDEYHYDEEGRLLQILNVQNNRKTLHQYNENGQLVEKTIEYKGNQVSKQTFTYDTDGNLKEFSSTDSQGNFSERRVFLYKCE